MHLMIARTRWLRLAAWLGAPAGLCAFAAPGLISSSDFKEHFDARVQVSGSTLVGLQRGPAAGPVDLARLQIDLPEGAKGMLCVDMTTRDGRYTASQDFQLSGAGPGPSSLGLPTSHYARDLKGYAAGDLAVRAQILPSCDSDAEPRYASARWSGPAESLIVQVNIKLSRGSVQLQDRKGERVGEAAPCTPVAFGSGTAYDHTCVIPLGGAPLAHAARLRLDIIGTTGGRRSETYAIGL